MRRISLFHGVTDDAAFVAAWRERRAAGGGTLLRSLSDRPEFQYAELSPGATDVPDLPASVRSAVYEPLVDDLPDDVEPGCMLVNAYELAPQEDDGFVTAWIDLRDTVRDAPGYQGSCLYRAVTPGATFWLVNV